MKSTGESVRFVCRFAVAACLFHLSTDLGAITVEDVRSRFPKQAFVAAPVSAGSDFCCPFLPEALLAEKPSVTLRAPVNARISLPVAVLNLADKAATYRVTVETVPNAKDYPNVPHPECLAGKPGLAGFPATAITARHGICVADKAGSERFESLPKMNELNELTAGPDEVALAWFDFDLLAVRPGTYHGRIRVESLQGGDGVRDIPVALEVLPFSVSRDAVIPTGFCQDVATEGMLELLEGVGARLLTVDSLAEVRIDEKGDLDINKPRPSFWKDVARVREQLVWAEKRGSRPRFYVGFDAYPRWAEMMKMDFRSSDCRTKWRQGVKAIARKMEKSRLTEDEFVLEIFDTPCAEDVALVGDVIRLTRETAPKMRLALRFRSPDVSADKARTVARQVDVVVLEEPCFADGGYRALADELRLGGKTVWQGVRTLPEAADAGVGCRQKAWLAEQRQATANLLLAPDGVVRSYGESCLPTVRYMSLRNGVEDMKCLAKLREVLPATDAEGKAFLAAAVTRVCEDASVAGRMRDEILDRIVRRIALPTVNVVTAATEETTSPIRVTRSPARLTRIKERKQPANDVLMYELVKMVQLSSDKVLAVVNRNIYTSRFNSDAEDGNDAFIIGSLDDLSTATAIPLNRSGQLPDVARGGRVRWHNVYPCGGGIVPYGAKLGGRPHPHAGTGYFLSVDHVYPISKDGTFDWREGGDFVAELQFFEVSYDGTNFAAKVTCTYTPDRPLMVDDSPWAVVAGGGLGFALPDGEDLLSSATVRHVRDNVKSVGMIRWRRKDGVWRPASFAPVAWDDPLTGNKPFETTLTRAGDGDLYLVARDDERTDGGGGFWGVDPKQDIYLWRSRDNGRNWQLVVRLDRARYHGPVGLGRTTDGRVIMISNPSDGDERVFQRKKLALWEILDGATGVVKPTLVRDSDKIGPNKLAWNMDHPALSIVRFADGKLHAVLGYRVRDFHVNPFNNDPIPEPTPGAGGYAEEVLSDGTPIPVWEF